MEKTLLIFFTAILTQSCSTLLDKKYSYETFNKDLSEIRESGEISEDEEVSIRGWVFHNRIKDINIEGKSYRDILKESMSEKFHNILDKEIEKSKLQRKKQRKLEKALSVILHGKGYEKLTFEEFLTYDFSFENKTNKDIRAFKGILLINDLFDERITSIKLTFDDTIKANETINEVLTTDYNEFRSQDIQLKNKDMDDLKTVWVPEKILFTDGTTLE